MARAEPAGHQRADFTTDASTLAELRRASERPASRTGERRQPGEPEAGALPGQRDISQPQVTLPPRVQS